MYNDTICCVTTCWLFTHFVVKTISYIYFSLYAVLQMAFYNKTETLAVKELLNNLDGTFLLASMTTFFLASILSFSL